MCVCCTVLVLIWPILCTCVQRYGKIDFVFIDVSNIMSFLFILDLLAKSDLNGILRSCTRAFYNSRIFHKTCSQILYQIYSHHTEELCSICIDFLLFIFLVNIFFFTGKPINYISHIEQNASLCMVINNYYRV